MAAKDSETVHHPDTPEWFIPYWEENQRQHGILAQRSLDLEDAMKERLDTIQGTVMEIRNRLIDE